jgi:hypothetical protein
MLKTRIRVCVGRGGGEGASECGAVRAVTGGRDAAAASDDVLVSVPYVELRFFLWGGGVVGGDKGGRGGDGEDGSAARRQL